MNPAKKYLEAAAEPEKESVDCLTFPCCFLLPVPSDGLDIVLLPVK
jgi:hypothetical protein